MSLRMGILGIAFLIQERKEVPFYISKNQDNCRHLDGTTYKGGKKFLDRQGKRKRVSLRKQRKITNK
ncbi:hypothetical protein CSB11_00920 [Candidatus Campbellbacteria bacterium]|nr:MAG: hypothetical protein CSB11_00920 [Candidatus Campbellbacteria bacterium]